MGNLLDKELKVKLSCFKTLTQMELFSNIDESMGKLSKEQVNFISSYALVSGNVRGLSTHASLTGRPMVSRERILKRFFLKAFLNIPTTKAARGFILSSYFWRRICGFDSKCEVLSEATLSRAFSDLSRDKTIASIHTGIIREYVKNTKTLILNANYDLTEITAREKGARKEMKSEGKTPPLVKRGRGGSGDRGTHLLPSPRTLNSRPIVDRRRTSPESHGNATGAARRTARGRRNAGAASSSI